MAAQLPPGTTEAELREMIDDARVDLANAIKARHNTPNNDDAAVEIANQTTQALTRYKSWLLARLAAMQAGAAPNSPQGGKRRRRKRKSKKSKKSKKKRKSKKNRKTRRS